MMSSFVITVKGPPAHLNVVRRVGRRWYRHGNRGSVRGRRRVSGFSPFLLFSLRLLPLPTLPFLPLSPPLPPPSPPPQLLTLSDRFARQLLYQQMPHPLPPPPLPPSPPPPPPPPSPFHWFLSIRGLSSCRFFCRWFTCCV